MPEAADLLAAVEKAEAEAEAVSRQLARWRLDTINYQLVNRQHRLEHPEEGWQEGADRWEPYRRPISASREALVKADLSAAVEAYVRAWQPGWKVLRGFMECDGRKPGGGEGPHLRRLLRRSIEDEIHPDRMPSVRSSFEPELADGEEIIEQCGSPVPIIVLGRLPYRREEEPQVGPRDEWRMLRQLRREWQR